MQNSQTIMGFIESSLAPGSLRLTSNRAVDRASRSSIKPFLLVLPIALGGCSLAKETTSAYAGLGVGATAGGVTGSPLLGVGVGALASWGVASLFDYFSLRTRAAIQSAIAAAASDIGVGEATDWATEEVSGRVEVTRTFGAMTACKEVLYSVEAHDQKHYFVGTICQLEQIWQWATPEAAAKQ